MTHDLARFLAAGAVALAFAALCWLCLRRRRGSALDGAAILVAYASQTGFAEALARSAAEGLGRSGATVELAELGDLTVEALGRAGAALFVAATTGDGDPPDRALRFARTALAQSPDLSTLQVGVLALGDRAYADYCGFGRRLDGWLQGCGARPLFDRIEVDAGDPQALARWRKALARLQPSASPAALGEPGAAPFRLVRRRLLNPQSLGEPAFLLTLAPLGALPAWAAGDVAEVERPGEGGAPALHREYSIASLPGDGAVELVVRRFLRPDGSPGALSGWLTGALAEGDEVRLKVRANRSFHAPDPPTPAVLIGAGTGLAGLRAHIRARAPGQRTWLLFGERSRAGDFLLAEEVEAWRAEGRLTRLDLAFSRDGDGPPYVQDLLPPAADDLRAWIAEGATLFVCGRQAMGAGVDAALAEILNPEQAAALREQGRYRRDVY